MAQPWEAEEEGFVYSGEALGDPRAGPSWRTCRAAAHTMPHYGVRAKPTHTLQEHTGTVDAAIPGPRGEERTGMSAASLPDACPIGRVGVRVDGDPLGSCTPLSHPGGWTTRPERLCAEVGSVCVFAHMS